MKVGLLFCMLFVFHSSIEGQNLIPNGGFELLKNPTCDNPNQAFAFLDNWYVLDATPDFFQGNCLLDESGSYFWDRDVEAYQGRNFAGLSSRWNSNATYFSEGIATRLSQPLEAGVTYFFQVAVLNRGGYQGFDEDVASCNLRPNKHIDIYLSRDSIRVDNNFSNGTSTTNGRLAARLADEAITSRVPAEDWTLISTCFEAEGGEMFLGITMPLGTFGDLPPCAGQSTSGVFRSFYYHLDEVQLTDTPDQLEASLSFCEGEELTVDLLDLLQQPILEEATFIWDDGVQSAQRIIERGGVFSVTAEIACGAIPIVLDIEALSCVPDVYIPDAFSPDGDGINDQFLPFIQTSGTIVRYEWIIFNRWGASVFRSEDPTEGWEGISRGQAAPAGQYLWKLLLEVETLEGPQILNKTGAVFLLK